MSLDTVLRIGNALKKSDESFKYFFFNKSPKYKGEYPLCLNIPISEDFTIDWDAVNLVPENKLDELYYLNYKTSTSDTTKKYVFGDIFSQNFKKSSFSDYEKKIKEMLKSKILKEDSLVIKFRNMYRDHIDLFDILINNSASINNYFSNPSVYGKFSDFIGSSETVEKAMICQIESMLAEKTLKELQKKHEGKREEYVNALNEKDKANIYIHFSFFEEKKHWYEFNDVQVVYEDIYSQISTNNGPNDSLALIKNFYNTLGTGDDKNDIQFPKFNNDNRYKSKLFDNETLNDLLYGIKVCNKLRKLTDTIKYLVLPNGDNLKASDYLEFFKNQDEAQIDMANQDSISIYDDNTNITTYDFIFKKVGQRTTIDVMEIIGIEKSKIAFIKEKIKSAKNEILRQKKEYYLNPDFDISFKTNIIESLKKLVGVLDLKKGKATFKENAFFESHVLKVLPAIYNENYYEDNILLSKFIDKVEFSIREGKPIFNSILFDLNFLYLLQNQTNNTLMRIKESQSYQIGVQLGLLAKQFRGPKSPIKSFEKNYVGNLLRRIGNIEDFIKFKNDVEQKLIMHSLSSFTYKISYDLAQILKDFEDFYDKEKCAFGFFESYFKPLPQKEEVTDKK